VITAGDGEIQNPNYQAPGKSEGFKFQKPPDEFALSALKPKVRRGGERRFQISFFRFSDFNLFNVGVSRF